MTAEPTFEEARQELERIVAQLESGQASLEDSVALWERGEELYRVCVAKLDAAQGKIEELGRRAGEMRPEVETSGAVERPDGAPPHCLTAAPPGSPRSTRRFDVPCDGSRGGRRDPRA